MRFYALAYMIVLYMYGNAIHSPRIDPSPRTTSSLHLLPLILYLSSPETQPRDRTIHHLCPLPSCAPRHEPHAWPPHPASAGPCGTYALVRRTRIRIRMLTGAPEGGYMALSAASLGLGSLLSSSVSPLMDVLGSGLST